MQKAQSIVQSFEQFLRENKNEITALQILHSRPYRHRLTLKQIDELAETIERPLRAWIADRLWQAATRINVVVDYLWGKSAETVIIAIAKEVVSKSTSKKSRLISPSPVSG